VLAVFLILWPLTKLSVDAWIISTEAVPVLTGKQAKSEKNQRRYRAAMVAAEVELRHKQRYIAAGTVVVVVLVSFIAFGVQGNRAKIPATADTANATSASGVKVGNQQAPVLVDLYEDFQCPICNNLEQSGLTKDFGAKIKATTIKVKLVSSADTGFYYVTRKNSRTMTDKLVKKKYDPVAKKHVEFRESKIK